MRQDLAEISKHNYDHSTFLIIIKDLICKHQRIITLSENIENLYTEIALMQILWNTLVICCTGFLIIIVSNFDCSFTEDQFSFILEEDCFLFISLQTINTTKDISTLIKSVNYYIAITLEAFIFCYAGEFLSAKVFKRDFITKKCKYPQFIVFYNLFYYYIHV